MKAVPQRQEEMITQVFSLVPCLVFFKFDIELDTAMVFMEDSGVTAVPENGAFSLQRLTLCRNRTCCISHGVKKCYLTDGCLTLFSEH